MSIRTSSSNAVAVGALRAPALPHFAERPVFLSSLDRTRKERRVRPGYFQATGADSRVVRQEMNIRPYRASDLESVARIFTEAVHELAASSYDNEQRSAWAPRPPDNSYWRQRLEALQTIVAEIDREPAGFLSYEEDGHIDLLYTAPAYVRRGVATALYRHVEGIFLSSAIAEIFTEASNTARPFFEHHGFRVVEEQIVKVRGVTLPRYAMRKPRC